jgi:hypothetical protein
VYRRSINRMFVLVSTKTKQWVDEYFMLRNQVLQHDAVDEVY